MRVIHRTPAALVVRDDAFLLRGIGVLFAAFGCLPIALVLTGAQESGEAVALVFGALFLAVGIALAVYAQSATYVFDRSERTLFVTRQRLGRRRHESYRFRDIASVEVERSTDSDGDYLYRIALVTADGQRHPWTSYYSSGETSKRAVVDAVRDFLSLTPLEPAQASAATAERSERALVGCAALFGASFGLLVLGLGARSLWQQERRLATYRPVPATVLYTTVSEHRDSEGGRSYKPVVRYSYTVNGVDYIGVRATPLERSGSKRAARDLIRPLEVGGSYTAYYDPARPTESFLVPQRSAAPVVTITIAGAVAVGALVGLRRMRGRRRRQCGSTR